MTFDQRIEYITRGSVPLQIRLKKYFRVHPEALEKVVDLIDNSDISLGEYLQGLEYLSHWLNEKERYLKLIDKLEYLSCTIEALDRKVSDNHCFVEGLKLMLDQYGCEQATTIPKS